MLYQKKKDGVVFPKWHYKFEKDGPAHPPQHRTGE
jgi:hypothetical protein